MGGLKEVNIEERIEKGKERKRSAVAGNKQNKI